MYDIQFSAKIAETYYRGQKLRQAKVRNLLL